MTATWIPNSVVNWLRTQDIINAWGEITSKKGAILESLSERRCPAVWVLSAFQSGAHTRITKDQGCLCESKENFSLDQTRNLSACKSKDGASIQLVNLLSDQLRLRLGSSFLGGSGVCSSFNGGDFDNVAQNINQVQGHLASIFPQILESLNDLHEGIYNGFLQEEGY
ncbi:hypothetical protein OnM2_025102 [Erysiphe neolycopersici]|uniref:Uncharacterized protein n=1 Tax=Erysiphe neolycopersici TaxID=212602 RepID=A0A420I166_9PEZI|nr:hypothetical protein OnM2_025102 [Erysiphe neolycopersici]